jgi:hypothetical protein
VSSASIVRAADGSGTNAVSPTSTTVNTTGNIFDFTFTAAETMDSGEVNLSTPTGWSTIQGTSGAAGYTTVSTPTGTLADVVSALDATTNWTATQHMTLSTSSDVNASSSPVSTFSLSNAVTAQAAAGEQWYFNYGSASNWGGTNIGNLRIGFWIKSSVALSAGDLQFQDDDSASLASPLDTINIPAIPANTWTYVSVTLGATTRTSILSYGFKYAVDVGAATIKVDSIAPLFNALDTNQGGKSDGSITRSFISTAGDFQEGTAAWRCAYAAGAGVGTSGECYFNNTNNAIGPGSTVSFWIRSSVALNAGDFVWIDDNNNDFGSPADTVDIPALAANTWTFLTLSAPNSSNVTVNSYGFRQVVDKGALNLDVDAMGKQVDAADATTGWTAPTATVQTLSTDTTTFHEGTGSLKNILTTGATSGDRWYNSLGASQNWSGYTTVGFWIRSTANVSSGDLQFEYSSNSDLSSPISSLNIGALTANTWTFQKLTLTGTRTNISSFGIKYVTNIGAATIYVDDILIGPGSPSYTSGTVGVRLLSLASSQTIIFSYGSGGGASGVTAPSTTGTATATTTSRVSDSGTLTNISSHPTLTATNPGPTTASISPTTKTVGDADFTLTVTGTGFISTSVVNFNGSARTTSFTSSSTITATIPSSDLTVATSSALITVTNQTPGGGTSNSQTFAVIAENPIPTITSISPSSATTGASGFNMTITGTNFIASSTAHFNGSDRVTTFVSSTQLTAAIVTADLAAATSFALITVANPTPGGGTSTPATFMVVSSVSAPAPTPSSGSSSGGVRPTYAEFSGTAYPKSKVQVFFKSQVSDLYRTLPEATYTISNDGTFKASFVALLGGEYIFGLQAEDADGRKTGIRPFSINFLSTNDLIARDIFMPPTLGFLRGTVRRGDTITVLGYGGSDNTLEFELDNKPFSLRAVTDSSGFYKVFIGTDVLGIGTHSIRVRQKNKTAVSDFSQTKTFTVSSLFFPSTDLNNDDKINISDWSIFLSKWSSPDPSTRAHIDFNGDGKTDLSDFSSFIRTLNR